MPTIEALEVGGDAAALELSSALALIRPRVPSWGFLPVPAAVRRVPASEGRRGQGGGVEEVMEVEVAMQLVKKRVPGERREGER